MRARLPTTNKNAEEDGNIDVERNFNINGNDDDFDSSGAMKKKKSVSSSSLPSMMMVPKNPWLLLVLGILFGAFLPTFMKHKSVRIVHRHVKGAYKAHSEASKEYLKRYRETYLEEVKANVNNAETVMLLESVVKEEEKKVEEELVKEEVGAVTREEGGDIAFKTLENGKHVKKVEEELVKEEVGAVTREEGGDIAFKTLENGKHDIASGRYLTSLLVDKVVNEGIFRSFVFTRWRTPAVYAKKGKKGEKRGEMPKMEKKLPPLSYDELANMPKVDRFSAMRAGLSRLAEFDFRHEYPPIYHKFDVVVFWSHWVSANALQYSTWQNGDICSCFIEIPEEAVPDILDDAIRGMKNSSPSKTCFRTLVFGGGDTHISNPRILNLVKSFHDSQYFDQIYYEAMDVGIEYIKPLPTGLLDFYVLGIPQGKFDSALKKINLGTKQGVLAAWGTVWPHLDRELPWRRSLIDWVNSTEWIQRSHIPMQNWHEELAKYRFYIVPDGNGVCSPKWAESLILQTIPIVPPLEYYKLLKEEGYPIVVVDSWDDITPQNMNLWWDELSSSLEAASWLHTTDCWWTYVSTPHTSVEEVLERCLPKSKCR